jgi:hypothetical protein
VTAIAPLTAIPLTTLPVSAVAAWVGTWRQYDNKIVLTRIGDRLSANGEAYWPGKSHSPTNEGGFRGACSTPTSRSGPPLSASFECTTFTGLGSTSY